MNKLHVRPNAQFEHRNDRHAVALNSVIAAVETNALYFQVLILRKLVKLGVLRKSLNRHESRLALRHTASVKSLQIIMACKAGV